VKGHSRLAFKLAVSNIRCLSIDFYSEFARLYAVNNADCGGAVSKTEFVTETVTYLPKKNDNQNELHLELCIHLIRTLNLIPIANELSKYTDQ